MHTCEFCGAPITGENRYCSDACRSKAKSAKLLGKPKKRIPKICADCGTSFLGYSRSIRCPECARLYGRKWAAAYKKRRAAGEVRPIGSTSHCIICGKPYTVNGGLQLYCSECIKQRRREIASEQYYARSASHTRICPVCGKTFIPSKRTRIYCSPECASKKPIIKKSQAASDRSIPIKANASAIAIRRIHLGFTQKQLAQKAGVSRYTVIKYENGMPISPQLQHAIEECLKEENRDGKN